MQSTNRFWKMTGIGALALATVALVFTLGGLTAPTAQAQEPGSNTITVSGYGEAVGSPDVAYITLGVDLVNEDLSAAISEGDTTMTAVVEAIQGVGVAPEDIQTTNFSVWTEDSFPSDGASASTRRYRINNYVRVTVRDTDQVQAVLDAALNAGANSIQGLNFGIDDVAPLERDARVAAIDDARERAGQIAEAIGATLGEPIIVNETSSSVPMYARAASVGLGGGGGIQEGQLTVDVQLEVTFSMSR